MEKEIAFHVLNIPETKDEAVIQNAYRTLLKVTNPEDSPEEFKRLRQAFETALDFARLSEEKEEDEGEKNEVDLWLEQVESLYQDIASRHDASRWQQLLDDPVCEGLDTSLEAREKLLAFLLSHIHLPHEIFKLFDKVFQILEDMEDLKQIFPPNFLDYLAYYIQNENFLPFDLFEYRFSDRENANPDGYIDAYLNIKGQIDNAENQGCLQALDDLQAYGIYHPYEDVERIRLFLRDNDMASCRSLLEKILEKAPDSPYVRLIAGQVYWQAGEKESACQVWTKLLEDEPDYYQAKYNVVRCLMEQGNYYEAREKMHELLDVNEQDQDVHELLKKANQFLIAEYQDKLERGEEDERFPGDELRMELGWCLFQNDRCEEAAQLLEGFTPSPEGEYSFNNLYGRLLFHMKRYEQACPYLEKWFVMLHDMEEDGTEETQKRMQRKNMAASILGGCYFELKQFDKAKATVREGIALAADIRERLGSMQQLAGMMLENKEYQEVIDICDEILREEDQYYPAYLYRQEASYELKRGQEVVDDYHRAIDIFPGYYKPYMFAAEVFFHYDQYEDGLKVLELAKENGVELTPRMKLYEVKLRRNLARSSEERKEIYQLLAQLFEEVQKPECDIEDKSEVEFEQGLVYWDDNDLNRALSYLKKAIQKNPDRMQYHFVCGNILLERKEFHSAMKEYSLAEEEYAESPALHYGKALCHDGLGFSNLALEEYQKTLSMEKVYLDACENVSDYYRKRYHRYYRKEDLEQAIAYASRQLEATENCYYLVNRGLLYMNSMNLKDAIVDFEKALEYREDDWPAWNNLGCCYKYLGEFEKAIGYFEKAAEYMEDDPDILPYSNMADCYEALGDYQKAINCYLKNLSMFPDRRKTWEEVGKLYSYMGKYKEALEAYESMNTLNEWTDDYYTGIAAVWMKMGDPKKSVSCYKKAIRALNGVKRAECYYSLGQTYCDERMDYKKAIYCFKKAININPDLYDVFNYERYMAKAYYLMKDYQEAKKHAQQALSCFQNSDEGEWEDYLAYKPFAPARTATMGWIYLCLGKKEDAVQCFRSMENMTRCRQCRYQKCFESSLYMGDFYASEGELEKALAEYEEALRRNPHCDEAIAAIRKIKQDRK